MAITSCSPCFTGITFSCPCQPRLPLRATETANHCLAPVTQRIKCSLPRTLSRGDYALSLGNGSPSAALSVLGSPSVKWDHVGIETLENTDSRAAMETQIREPCANQFLLMSRLPRLFSSFPCSCLSSMPSFVPPTFSTTASSHASDNIPPAPSNPSSQHTSSKWALKTHLCKMPASTFA